MKAIRHHLILINKYRANSNFSIRWRERESDKKGLVSWLYLFICFCLLSTYAQSVEIKIQDDSVSSVKTRLYNIELMRHVLKKNEYQGYDILIISSSTNEEAHFQQKYLENVFSETSNKEGQNPIILSVVDETEGGQLIGSVYIWQQAEEKLFKKYPALKNQYVSLVHYSKSNNYKVAMYHNGGRGERCSPLTQSLGNSRGAQKLVGSILNAQDKEFELDVLLAVILQCSSFAKTNPGSHLDVYWTSQIAFGSYPHDQLKRSLFAIDKFLVEFDKQKLIPQNIADFGTAALTDQGRMVVFYGNKRFASRKGNQYIVNEEKIDQELFSKSNKVAYDFGSFSVNLQMWQLILEYWNRKNPPSSHGSLSSVKRDIDPHFIQPFIRFLYGIHEIADPSILSKKLSSFSTLKDKMEIIKVREDFDLFMKEQLPLAHAYIWQDANNEIDPTKKVEAINGIHEVMEFYLLYHQQPVLKDLDKIFGFIDLGNDIQWFRYRRPIDIMNEKFEMLTDLIHKKIEIQLNGLIDVSDADFLSNQRALEARLMRGIAEEKIVSCIINGKKICLSLEEVKEGKWIEEVYIKNSIVQNSHLIRGSSIVNSVVNNTTGKIIAHHAYIESSTAPFIEASSSIVHQVIDQQKIVASQEIVSDVYRASLQPAYHGRMRAPIGYDPKGMVLYKVLGKNEKGELLYSHELEETIRAFIERISYDFRGIKEYSDKTAKTEDGHYSFEQIREIKPHREQDQEWRENLERAAKSIIF